MANICSTEYKIYGPKKDLDVIYETIEEMLDEQDTRLCELVDRLGGDSSEMYCRGEIRYQDYDDLACELTIQQDTAWREQSDVRHFLEERFSDITVYYFDEEPGCDWFQTNDINKEIWDIEWVLDDTMEGTQYFDNLEEIAEYINETYKPQKHAEPNEESIWDVMKRVQEKGDGELYILHQFHREND